MKSVRKIFFIFISCALLATFTACGGTLAAPEDVNVDLENTLTWSAVTNASAYTVEISTLDGSDLIDLVKEEKSVNTYRFDSRRTTVELSNSNRFTLNEGDYIIKIKALGKTKGTSDSDWSEQYSFHKEYETGCKYALINGGTEYEVNRVGKASGAIVIEDYYRGKPVTRIADQAFKGSVKIVDVTVGNNVTYIGKAAFSSCPKLERVVLPEGVTTIGESAFQSCSSLKEMVIPSTVKEIPYNTFAYCASLEKVTLNEGLENIGELAFAYGSSLKEITIPDTVKTIGKSAFTVSKALETVNVGAGVETIKEYAFSRAEALKTVNFAAQSSLKTLETNAFSYCTKLTGVALPDGTEDLGEACFYGDSEIKEISIPDSVNHVGFGAFDLTGLYEASGEYVYADKWLVAYKSETRDVVSLGKDQIKEGTYAIADSVFTKCQRLSDVTLPSSVEIVGKQAFIACPLLYKVIMPKVRVIAYGAFATCPILTNVDFGDVLTTIEGAAFYGCSTFDNNKYSPEDTLPDSVRKIGALAFYGTQLWNNATNGVVFCGKWAVGTTTFGKKDMLGNWESISTANLTIDEKGKDKITCVGIADYAFIVQQSMTTITATENVRYIGKGAFYACQALTGIALSDDLRDIPDYAFLGCQSMMKITLPSRLRSIGKSAFYACARLREVDIPDSTTSIGTNAFNSCANLVDVKLGEGITEIPDFAFFNSGLGRITIPENVTVIGRKAFGSSRYLKNVIIEGNVTEIGYAAFYKTRITSIKLPDSLERIENSTFYGATALSSVDFGKGVKEIGEYAFYGTGFRNIAIPENVETIESYAFASTSARSITLRSSLKNIAENAFYNATPAVVYAESEEALAGWQQGWNSSVLPVIYGSTISAEGYVESFTVSQNNTENVYQVVKVTDDDGEHYEYTTVKITLPGRAGLVCAGFATTPDATEAEYTDGDVFNLPDGTVLYTVWREADDSDNPFGDLIDDIFGNPDNEQNDADSQTAKMLLSGAVNAFLTK